MAKTADEKIAALESGVPLKRDNGIIIGILTVHWDDAGEVASMTLDQYVDDRKMSLIFDGKPKEPRFVYT